MQLCGAVLFHIMPSTGLLALAAALASPQISFGFAPPSALAVAKLRTTKLFSETKPSSLIDSSREGIPELSGALETCELHEFLLNDHKPLGCSVEEGLASEPDAKKYVFVSEVSWDLGRIELKNMCSFSWNLKNMCS